MGEPIRVVRPDDLQAADPTPGMLRRRAFDAPGLWTGLVDTEPGAASGWHHHGEHESGLYVLAGTLRLDFGPDGGSTVEAHEGDFVHVPAGVVHREANPGATTSRAVIARAGRGVPTVNVEGPESG